MRRAAAVAIGVVLAMLVSSPATADTPPYEYPCGGRTELDPSPTGTASADYTADEETCELSVEASATEEFPLPFSFLGPSSEAFGGAGGVHEIPVAAAGAYDVRVTLESTSATATVEEPGIVPVPLTGGRAEVEASMFAVVFDCSSGTCTNIPDLSAEASDFVTLACSGVTCTTQSGTVILEDRLTVPDGTDGFVYVQFGIGATAVARGQGAAEASGSTTVASIELVPAP